MSMLLVLFHPLIGHLSGATTPGQSGTESDGNEGVFRIPQSSSIAGTSPSDCLVSNLGHSLGGGLTPLPRCSQCILRPQLTGQFLIWILFKKTEKVNTDIYPYIRRSVCLSVSMPLSLSIYQSQN